MPVQYRQAVDLGSNKITGLADGTTASDAAAFGQITPKDGWIADTDTWVYVSATSFKIVGANRTAKFPKGTKVSYNDGSVDYGVVASATFSTDTTVTLFGTSDYSIANATLTAPRYSYQSTPQGFPGWFNWAPTLTGWSAAPSLSVYRWHAIGRVITMAIDQLQGDIGTSNTTGWQITLPSGLTAPSNYSTQGPYGIAVNNGAAATAMSRMVINAGATVMIANVNTTTGAWTAANAKGLAGQIPMEF